MTKESRRKKILWLEHLFWVLGAWTLLGRGNRRHRAGQRPVESRLAPLSGQPPAESDRQPRRSTHGFRRLVFPDGQRKRPGDSRQRAAGHGASLQRRAGEDRTAHRFLLGTPRLAERSGPGAAQSSPARRKRRQQQSSRPEAEQHPNSLCNKRSSICMCATSKSRTAGFSTTTCVRW